MDAQANRLMYDRSSQRTRVQYESSAMTSKKMYEKVNAMFVLAQDDFGGALAVHAVAWAVSVLQHGTHALAGGVEGVDLVELLLRHLLAYGLVVPLHIQHQAQQGALRLVAHVPWQTTLLLWRLGWDREQRSISQQGGHFVQTVKQLKPAAIFFLIRLKFDCPSRMAIQ